MRPTVTDAAPKGMARRLIAAGIAVLGVLAIAGVVIGYFLFVRYTPLAERHIPGASNVAIRADARQIGTFAPVRKHLWPLLVDRPSSKAGKTFADRVAENTGINPALDIRELIVASMDSKSWVLLVGGNFKPGKFVPGMEKVFHEEGHPEWHRNGDLLIGPTGIAMGQADDGTLVLGTEAEIVDRLAPRLRGIQAHRPPARRRARLRGEQGGLRGAVARDGRLQSERRDAADPVTSKAR